MSQSISQIVPVSLLVSAMPQAARNFGSVALFGVAARLPSEDRMRTYTDLASVAVDFQTTDPEYLKATVFFAQSSSVQPLKIGRFFPSGAAGHLNSGAVGTAGDLAAIQAVTTGGMDITVAGTLCQLSALDFHTDTTFTAVASRLQTALNAAKTGTTCTYDGTKLIITAPSLADVTVASAPTAGGSPTPIQTILKLTLATAAVVCPHLDAETTAQSLTACRNEDSAFYGVMYAGYEVTWDDAASQILQDAAAWAVATDLFFTCTTMAADCKAPTGTTSAPSNLMQYMQGMSYSKVACRYSGTSGYADAAIQGLFSTVNYSMPNSIITAFMKELIGILSDDLTTSEVLAIAGSTDGATTGQNGDVLTTFGSLIRNFKGMVASGRFIDEIIALDWLKDGLQTGVFNVMATSTTRVPGTDAGTQRLIGGMMPTWNTARSNGLIAPGFWLGADVGEIKTGDYLPNGFYIYASPVSGQSTADRAARKAPAIACIAIGAGALQYCAIQVEFQR